MEDYSWTKVESSVERNSVIIQGINMNKKDKSDSNKDSNVNKDNYKGDQRLNVMRMKKRGLVGRQGMNEVQQKVRNSNSSGNNDSVKGSIKGHNECQNGSTKNGVMGGVMLHTPINTSQSYYNNIRPLNNYYNNQLNTINNPNNHSISNHQHHQYHSQPY